MYEDVEKLLRERGLSETVRKAIRDAKICIVDDGLTDLRSFVEGLKLEGFTHIVEKQSVSSVNELVDGHFDLLILDLTGITSPSVDAEDGYGILAKFKKAQPFVPVLVVSGAAASVDRLKKLNDADLIRNKPVRSAALAEDIDELLAWKRDEHWAALGTLRELSRIEPELKSKLGFWKIRQLRWQQYRIERKLRNLKPGVVDNILKVATIVTRAGSIAVRIISISKGLGTNA